MSPATNEQSRWRQLFQSSMLWVFAISLTIGLTAIFSINLITSSGIQLEVDQRAPEDIRAPRALTYDSDYLLNQAREQARADVVESYFTPEGEDIGRQQLQQVNAVFAFIDTVRADTLASTETKTEYLQSLELLTIEPQTGLDLLALSGSEYEQVKTEVKRIVGDIMRNDIRDSQLRDFQRQARQEASLFLTPIQENVVTSLAPQFIVPTEFPDVETTELLREEAVANVAPIPVTIVEGELIVRLGARITELDLEKLNKLGLLEDENPWRTVTSLFMASLLGVVIITLYWTKFARQLWERNHVRYLTVLEILILFFALLASIMMGNNNPLIYWFPMAALSLLLGVVFEARLSMTVTVVLAGLIGFATPNSLELVLYTAAGGLLAILTLRDEQRFNAIFRSGLIAAVGYIVVVVMFRFPLESVEILDLLPMVGTALGNGILSAGLTLVGFYLMGSLFGITTSLQLQELSRLDHPLLQELLRRAPGTYHHSIMVANLAEQAADKIKANSTLIRVGAFYHDIGKMNRPPFFTENQEGINPHDSLDPFTSARIIINHVSDGLELAKQYKLPEGIRDFIAQHHGERIVKGFYFKATENAQEGENVDIEQFRYLGPRPRSKETGIVMLADAIESASRALQPNSEKAIEKLVNSLIDGDLTEGQLDNSGLTLGDIHHIRASFIKTLKGRFHVRVKYPGNEALEVNEDEDTKAETAQETPPAPSSETETQELLNDAAPEANDNGVEQQAEPVPSTPTPEEEAQLIAGDEQG